MRGVALLLLVLSAHAQATRTRTVVDATGRLQITVPESWEDQPLAEGEALHLHARLGGGHVLIAVREAGQSDVDQQRSRYMEHDAARYPGAEFQKVAEPFFGYRVEDQAKNRVLMRAFLRDGIDGIVVTISSRLQGYAAHAARIADVLASAKVAAGAPAAATAGPSQRLFDKAGRFSVVVPLEWKRLAADEEDVLLFLGHKGTASGPTLRIVEEGDQDNPALVLITIQNRWKKDYGSVDMSRLGATPPALLARNRKEGWIDYLIAFAAGGRGYTLRLAVREGSFEHFRPLADEMARSIVFMGDPYRAPTALPGDLALDHRKSYVVHAAAEEHAAAEATVKEMGGFDREWGRIAPTPARKAQPLHVVLARPEAFADAAHGFGEPPAAYDRLACAVVAVPPPAERDEAARWRGRLYAALAEAALHRDLDVAPPPWLLAGLTACMEAAGRTGDGASAAHPGLAPLLKAALDPAPLRDVLAYSYGDMIQGESAQPLAMSWAYIHAMLFGKGTLRSLYAKWEKSLAKATRKAPPFDLGRYAEAEAEAKKHIEREILR